MALPKLITASLGWSMCLSEFPGFFIKTPMSRPHNNE